MENASKALLIAAGVLVGVILITMIMYGYDQIAGYYRAKEEQQQIEQLAEFNNQYLVYYKDNVRGSDLVSLVNKIMDFNALNNEQEEIQISIKLSENSSDKEKAKMFYYKYDENQDVKLVKLTEVYTQNNINTILNKAYEIDGEYMQPIATKLSSNMSTLMGENSRKTPEELFAELKIVPENYGGVDKIRKDILQYYQYLQFKRAHFDCTDLKYTSYGRVKSFTFKFNGTFE